MLLFGMIFGFPVMDTYHIFWLMDELDVLVKKHVITEETSKRIADYYAAQTDSASPQDAAKKRHFQAITAASIPVLLSVIAAVLIAAGIISLTAYNWNVIPRTVKAVFAFVLLLAVQAGGVSVSIRENLFSKAAWREGAAVLWSLMFGGVVTFISQICRLPGDTASFLLVWAVSSILLTYAMRSLGAFVISLILASAYAFASDGVNGSSFLFCLLFASLCPFALRFKYGRYIMLVVFAFMMNVILDGKLFGLRMICNVSFAVLCLEYGITRNSKYVKFISAAGLCLLLLYISFSGVWSGRNLDWNHITRNCSAWGLAFDGLLAFCCTGLAVAWQFVPHLHKKAFPRWQLAYPLCALVVAVFFVVYSCIPQGNHVRSLGLAPTAMFFLFSVLFLVHTLYSKRMYSYFLLGFLLASSCVMELNCPVVSLSAFILLFEATGRYHASRNEKDSRAAYVASRILMAIWMPCVALLLQEGLALSIFKQDAVPFQMISSGLIALAAFVLLFLSHRWKDTLDILILLAVMLILSAVLWRGNNQDVEEKSLYAFLYIFVIVGAYGFARLRLHKRHEYLPYVITFVLVTIACLYRNTGTWFLCPPVMLLLCGLYLSAKERKGGSLWGILCAGTVFASAFAGGSFYHARYLDLPQRVPVCIALSTYAFMSLLPAARLLKKKVRFNYVLAFHALVVTGFLLVILAAGISGNSPHVKLLDKAMSFTSFACVFLVAGYFIYEAYMEGSLAKANIAACYAALALIIKFFSDDYGFVSKGILFIVLGVVMLLLNLLLLRMERNRKTTVEVQNEADR